MSTHSISRRKFIKTSGGVVLLIGAAGILPQIVSCKNAAEAARLAQKHQLSAWVFLAENGEITIFNPAADMGQGSMTSLPLIFAEEMDADWDKVNVEFSPQEPGTYGSNAWGNRGKIMLTAGSNTIKGYYAILRQAGAQARYILLNSVAKHWEIPINELTTQPGLVIHQSSGRKMSYGKIVPILSIPESLPEISESQMKNPKDFRLIGKNMPRYDIPGKVNGSAKFAIDLQFPDMLYGVIERGKVHGAQPTLKNDSEILSLNGVVEVVTLDYGIGIIANSLENALAAKKQLDISWSGAKASGFNSQEAYDKYEKIANQTKSGKVVTEKGDFKKAFRNAAKTYIADYKNDYVYHAQMEPLNGVGAVSEDGKSIEIWIGNQQGFYQKEAVGKALDIAPENVKINLYYLGGGFGRRSKNDFMIETGLLAKAVAPRQVKLFWERKDDLQYGMYRPLSLQRLKACVDKTGKVTGLAHYIIGDGDNLLASGIKNNYYDIANQYGELHIVPEGIRLKHWRSVGHGPNKFAIECMIDEIAIDQQIDPVDFRRQLMKDSPRALATLEKAVEISNWGKPLSPGRAKGVAFLERSGTLSTGVCEISVDKSSGKIKVHRFWSANDAGVIVHPDNVKAQMEGGIIMGMSSVLKEQLTIKEGEVQQYNFHDYHLLRMEDVPDSIETALIDSSEAPQGVGESGTPLVACAIANAFAALTGKRLRHIPFTPERVLEALNS